MKQGFLTLFLLAFCANLFAQPKARFSRFKGPIYSIPAEDIMKSKGYGPHVEEYNVIGNIDWVKINIPDRSIDEPFPDVTRKTSFGMVLHSEMTIEYKACYEFELETDDGSLFWLDKKLVINNKGNHKMKLVKDTIQLDPGTYQAKIWYHQAFPDRYGFIFDSKYVGPPGSCKKGLGKDLVEKITINNKVLFDTDSAVIKDEAMEELVAVSNKINAGDFSKMTIVGHTDSDGDNNYNDELSLRRAHSIKSFFEIRLKGNVEFKCIGLGEQHPVDSNDTAAGRQNNRRVEIVVR